MGKQPRRMPAPVNVPWGPVNFTEGEIASIKAFASLHRVGFEAIIHKLCRFDGISFAMGGEEGRRETDFAEGKRWVAKQLLNVVALQLRPRTRGPEPPMPPSETGESASAAQSPEQTAPSPGRS